MADSHHNFGPKRASIPPSSPPHPTPDFLLADAPMFTRVFRNSPVGMGIAGADGRHLAINDAFARMIGWSVAVLLGRPPVELGLMSAGDPDALASDSIDFDPQTPHHGRGLLTMIERCDRLGGDLTVLSRAGLGTTMRLIVPTI